MNITWSNHVLNEYRQINVKLFNLHLYKDDRYTVFEKCATIKI